MPDEITPSDDAPVFKLIGVIDSKQGRERLAWLDGPLTRYEADPTCRPGTWMEITRNTPDADGVTTTVFHHPADEGRVRLEMLRRANSD